MIATVLSGCGGGGRGVPMDDGKMNMQEAAERADFLLDGTLQAVKPGVAWSHGVTTTGNCEVTRRRVVMTQISEQRRGSFLGLVDRYWRSTGYEITAVNRSEANPAIYANSADGFELGLTFGYKGQAFLEAATPCVRKSEVAEPATPANAPRPEWPIPRPDTHDDFWSSTDALPSSSRSAL
ncbi:hypothetical protein [Streptomyces fuscigenes]|uniref:hypothetical protein n=1 Tax=Streptomyces fuscigenes TaxID=1528880 RepID=UPI0027E1927B|nr:hypothetical protein [Streptomyces fuscigenes]